jgi:hypothetical protein
VRLCGIPARAAASKCRVEVIECNFFVHAEATLSNSAKPYYI